jgi:hypothetical protein
MLEKQGYPEGEIFRQPNVWTQTRLTGFGLRPDYYTASFRNTVREDDSVGYYAERWDSFVSLIREANDETFRRELPQMLDLDKYLTWNALTWIFGSLHSHWGDDLRWYYDNTSGLFEPILYDVLRDPVRIPAASKGDRPLWKFEGMERDSFARRVMEIPEYRQAVGQVPSEDPPRAAEWRRPGAGVEAGQGAHFHARDPEGQPSRPAGSLGICSLIRGP